MPSSERFKPTIPEYVKYMSEDSLFSAKDLMEMFGFRYKDSVHQLVERGLLPKHDIVHKNNRGNVKIIFQWKKSTIMNYIKETWGDL